MRSIYEGLPRMAIGPNTKGGKITTKSGMINTRRTSGKRGERESMFPSPMKTPGKR